MSVWEEVLLTVIGMLIAFALLLLLYRLLTRNSRPRDKRLEACVAGLQGAWGADAPGSLDAFVTPSLHKALRKQLARLAEEGKVVHSEDPEVTYLVVLQGGRRRDESCVALVNYKIRRWVTDASGKLLEGGRDPSAHGSYWRFVRDPVHAWLVDGIDVPSPVRRGKERFEEVAFSKEERYALEIDRKTGKPCISFPVFNGLVEYNEYYEIDQASFERFQADLDSAREFVARCRNREMDHLMIGKPAPRRGSPS